VEAGLGRDLLATQGVITSGSHQDHQRKTVTHSPRTRTDAPSETQAGSPHHVLAPTPHLRLRQEVSAVDERSSEQESDSDSKLDIDLQDRDNTSVASSSSSSSSSSPLPPHHEEKTKQVVATRLVDDMNYGRELINSCRLSATICWISQNNFQKFIFGFFGFVQTKLVATKPLVGTTARQILKYQVGSLPGILTRNQFPPRTQFMSPPRTIQFSQLPQLSNNCTSVVPPWRCNAYRTRRGLFGQRASSPYTA